MHGGMVMLKHVGHQPDLEILLFSATGHQASHGTVIHTSN